MPVVNEDDSNIFHECIEEEPNKCKNVLIFKGFRPSQGRMEYALASDDLPPRSFLTSFENTIPKQSNNYSLLAWLLNSEQVKLANVSVYHSNALSIFSLDDEKKYTNFLDIIRRDSETEKSELSLDATLVNKSLETDDYSSYVCYILPIPQQKTEYDKFKMELLLEDYKRQLKKIFRTYRNSFRRRSKFSSKYLQQNLTLVTRAYIRDLFYDITFKYASLRCLSTYQKMHLLKELQQNHKLETFLIDGHSISEFITTFDRMTCYSCATPANSGTKLTYGVWFDGEMGVILLCNGIMTNWDMLQLPTYAYKINDGNIHDLVMKYMFFLNMSVLETCLRHF